MSKNKQKGRFLRPREVKMETKIKEGENLQIVTIDDTLMETLRLSPFFVEMPKDEYEKLCKALHKEGFC